MGDLDLDTLAEVRVSLTVMLGRATALIGDVLRYAPGTIVPLEVAADAAAPILVNGVAIAMGDLVATEDGFLAVQITELIDERRPT
ncbi:MAG TPA: FliM/FliN family flagellar motor switch protein [Candidatus Acidoferrales bacterium]|nr:FliM/FliN family flagellar motor switch protein [Candidatus Acidoferrales bacterium]